MLTLTMPAVVAAHSANSTSPDYDSSALPLTPEAMGDAAADVLEAGRPAEVADGTELLYAKPVAEAIATGAVTSSEIPAAVEPGGEPAAAEIATTVESPAAATFTTMTEIEWQDDHTARMREAEANCQECEDAYEDAAEAAKSKKKRLDSSIAILREIARDTYEKAIERQRLAREEAARVAAANEGQGEQFADSAASDSASPNHDITGAACIDQSTSNAWRSVDILELTNADLSPAVAQKLKDAEIATIGQLEDLRGEISLGRAKWPKGIGEKKITAIEDAVVAWLNKFRGMGGTEHVPVTKVEDEPASDATAETIEPASTAVVEPSATTMKPAEWHELSAEAKREFIFARIDELGAAGSLDEQLKSCGYWQQGYDAGTAANGDASELESRVEFSPSPAQDDWLRGWIMANVEISESVAVEPATANADEPATTVAATTGGVELVNVDDL